MSPQQCWRPDGKGMESRGTAQQGTHTRASAPHTAVSCSALDSSFFLFILQKPWSPQKHAKVNWGITWSRRGLGAPPADLDGDRERSQGSSRVCTGDARAGQRVQDRSPKSQNGDITLHRRSPPFPLLPLIKAPQKNTPEFPPSKR